MRIHQSLQPRTQAVGLPRLLQAAVHARIRQRVVQQLALVRRQDQELGVGLALALRPRLPLHLVKDSTHRLMRPSPLYLCASNGKTAKHALQQVDLRSGMPLGVIGMLQRLPLTLMDIIAMVVRVSASTSLLCCCCAASPPPLSASALPLPLLLPSPSVWALLSGSLPPPALLLSARLLPSPSVLLPPLLLTSRWSLLWLVPWPPLPPLLLAV
jgi:hypothetical protein